MRRIDAWRRLRLLAVALALLAAGCGPRLGAGVRTITVAADRPVGECYDFWSVGNLNKPHALLDPEEIRTQHEAAPFVREFNVVYLLGGRYEGENEWFLGVDPDGTVRTDFTGMIAQLKAAMAAGYSSRVVLDNVPPGMSDPPRWNFFGNTAPPGDRHVWHKYVAAAVRAMVEAFGAEEVGKWTFRVGTEPDIGRSHWAGTREEYLAHYDYTVDAVRGVLPAARIGPGNIMNPAWYSDPGRRRRYWGLHIIDHCATGKNACTGGVGAPMDVFQLSFYPGVGDSVDVFKQSIGTIRRRLDRYPQFREVPIEVGEFAVLRDERNHRLYAGDTTEWSAGYYAALADRVYALGVRQVFEWDHATFGVLHPKGHVIGMLRRMAGGRRLAVEVRARSAANCGAVACRKGDDLFVLLYNQRPARLDIVHEKVHLVISDPALKEGHPWRLSEWAVDRDHTVWAYEFEKDCRAAGLEPLPRSGYYEGNPEKLYGEAGVEVFHSNAEKYTRLAQMPPRQENVPVKVKEGCITLDLVLPGHGVRFLRLSPEG